jgi:hypothetical protein
MVHVRPSNFCSPAALLWNIGVPFCLNFASERTNICHGTKFEAMALAGLPFNQHISAAGENNAMDLFSLRTKYTKKIPECSTRESVPRRVEISVLAETA